MTGRFEERTFETHAVEQTESLGERLAEELQNGDVVCLHGNLGAGKTAWVKGLARGLRAERTATSPTFTLINEYPGARPLYHFDLYRLNRPEELEDLGYEEYFYSSGVSVVEWAEKAPHLMPEKRWDITFEIMGENDRRIRVVRPILG
ncbi:MAG: tRNA (adenosine(37)-N6)-threonylcarbamoyltransferase complex ATPase subunit type 1 TsaE [Candidatus Firestonebacteria bacterium]|nr:tRNA (adenosine(37)-N6)-threonylcarbamoyltransferase complex ATPase subunit type 1 TsaE [Candidatus Firestonebacteria bacterium]